MEQEHSSGRLGNRSLWRTEALSSEIWGETILATGSGDGNGRHSRRPNNSVCHSLNSSDRSLHRIALLLPVRTVEHGLRKGRSHRTNDGLKLAFDKHEGRNGWSACWVHVSGRAPVFQPSSDAAKQSQEGLRGAEQEFWSGRERRPAPALGRTGMIKVRSQAQGAPGSIACLTIGSLRRSHCATPPLSDSDAAKRGQADLIRLAGGTTV